MNRVHSVIATIWVAGMAHCHGGLRLEELGHTFKNEKLVVSWRVPTNSIPEFLNVFNVSPAQWTQGFISNIVAIRKFEEPVQVYKALSPALRGLDARYTDDAPQGSRTTIILNPSNGRLLYYREGVIPLPKQPVEGVPSEEESVSQAIEVFSRLGLPTSELRRKPGKPRTEDIYYTRDVTTRSTVGNREKKVVARGLYLVRAIDGFGIDGVGSCGGMSIRFGNHGKIAELELVWPRIHSPRPVRTAETNQILSWVRQGKATIATDYEPGEIKSLTVTNAAIWYFGSKALPLQSLMHPFLSLDAVAEIGQQHVPVRVNCPVLRD